jgi:hypothetical protein
MFDVVFFVATDFQAVFKGCLFCFCCAGYKSAGRISMIQRTRRLLCCEADL